MSDASIDSIAELTPHERAQVLAWAKPEVGPDFAAQVVIAWQGERARTEPEVDRGRPRRSQVGWSIAVAATLLAASLVAWLAGVAWRSDAFAPDRPASPLLAIDDTRREAHAVLIAACMPCHHSADAHAQSDALAVFDLADPRWWSSPSDTQLGRMLDRLGDDVAAPERERLERFVAAELDARRAAPR